MSKENFLCYEGHVQSWGKPNIVCSCSYCRNAVQNKKSNDTKFEGDHVCPKCSHITKINYKVNHRCVKCGYIPDLDRYVS